MPSEVYQHKKAPNFSVQGNNNLTKFFTTHDASCYQNTMKNTFSVIDITNEKQTIIYEKFSMI